MPGTYTLQAAIVACHARALTADATDWPRIAALYGTLARVAPSPVVELIAPSRSAWPKVLPPASPSSTPSPASPR